MATTTTDLVRTQFSGLDFDTHEDDLRARIQVQFGAIYNDFAVSSIGIMLLDIVSFGLDTLSFYLDRRATDTYLSTVRTRKSTTRLARQLGYKPSGAVASAVDLNVTPAAGSPFPFTLPKGFQFLGPNELIFEVVQDVLYPGPSTETKSVLCSEGETITETFFSDGSAQQVFELRRVPENKTIAQGSVLVAVGGTAWVESKFLDVSASDQFEVTVTDSPPTLQFGDGVVGNIPANGAEIKVTYFATSGKAGLVASATIIDVVTPLVVAFTPVDLTITNPKASQGGDDAESIDRTKVQAPKVFNTRDRAVTRADYEAIAGSYADPLFGKVAVAQALSPRSSADEPGIQTQLAAIEDAIEDMVAPVSAAIIDAEGADGSSGRFGTLDTLLASIGADATSISTSAANADTTNTTLASELRTMKASAQTSKVEAQESKDRVSTSQASVSNSQSTVVTGKAAIDAILTAGSDQLTSGTKTALKAYFDSINTDLVSINTDLGLIDADADSVVTQSDSIITTVDNNSLPNTDTIDQELTAIGISTTTGLVDSIIDDKNLAVAEVGNIGVDPFPSSGLRLDIDNIQAAVVSSSTGIQSTVGDAISEINDILDRILAADCQANVVTVPILAVDAAGFFARPTTGLVDSLQSFLDARKEVTQAVIVTSGESALVSANMTVRVGVSSGFAAAATAAAVSTVIDGVLKGRKFGGSLFVSELFDAILGQVAGVSFLNVTITGFTATLPGASIDSNGNLIISTSQIVTKGIVTITTEAAA